MSSELKITAILFLLFISLLVLLLVKKNSISVKYSLVWLIPSVVLIIFIIIPQILEIITHFLGFQTSSNMIFALLIGFMIIVNISLTVIVTNQKNQIRILIQELSILKGKVDEKQ